MNFTIEFNQDLFRVDSTDYKFTDNNIIIYGCSFSHDIISNILRNQKHIESFIIFVLGKYHLQYYKKLHLCAND